MTSVSYSLSQRSGLICQRGQSRLPLVLSVAVLAIGGLIAWAVFSTTPEPKKVAKQPVARLVEAMPLVSSEAHPQWPTGGQATAVEQVSLTPRVSGQVASINANARPGARFSKGTVLAQLDPADYQLALQQARADLAQAKAALTVEQGEVSLAQEEYELAGRSLQGADKALVLREPQLQSARAQVARAEAAVQQAELNLQRTRITMPFDGQLISRDIAVGMQASSSTALFEVVNTDAFWIEVKVPRQFLPFLDGDGEALVSHPAWGLQHRRAAVLDVVPAVNAADRLARVVLELSDPLASQDQQQPAVLLNDYLDVVLPGKAIAGAIRIPLAQLDELDRVWVVDNNALQQRQLQVVWRGRTHAWVTEGLQQQDQLLMSQLDPITAGMPVRVAQHPQAAADNDSSLASTEGGQ